ncbi:hypothetical protein [Lachnotalea glycerini]|uniref:hypothetical protein n=1 Tax=Lachnotalea glycerini TaxID=1763509 RepID=UPI0011C03DAF|nr:hypothetical protein [Lachnotalea glycerini]
MLEKETINHFLKGRGHMQMKKIDVRVEEVRGKICELARDNERHIYIIIKVPRINKPIIVRIDRHLELLMAS